MNSVVNYELISANNEAMEVQMRSHILQALAVAVFLVISGSF